MANGSVLALSFAGAGLQIGPTQDSVRGYLSAEVAINVGLHSIFYPMSHVPHIETMSHILIGSGFQKSNHCRTISPLKSGFYPIDEKKAGKAVITGSSDVNQTVSQHKVTSYVHLVGIKLPRQKRKRSHNKD